MTRQAGFGEFFRYHGWLAPGVRLFRAIGFPAKALWVSLAFATPLVMMLVMLGMAAQAQVDSARSERDGLRYVQPVLELLNATRQRRMQLMAGKPLAEAQAQVEKAFKAVQARETELGGSFGTAKSFEALRSAHQALLTAPTSADSPDATFAKHADFAGLSLKLLRVVADGSQLALDPDLDTYHMMLVAVMHAPKQEEFLGELRGLGALVLGSGQMTPTRHDALLRAALLVEEVDADIEASWKQGIAPTPELARGLDMEGTDRARDAFMTTVRSQLLGATVSGDVVSYQVLATAAVEKTAALTQAVLQRLDQRLQARIDRLYGVLWVQLGVATAFVALAAYLMLAFYRVLMGGMQEVAGHLRQITQGNLTTAPRPWGRDEAALLMVDLRSMQDTLRQMVQAVRASSEDIVHTSSEIASGAMNLSARTEQTAANLEESAASMEQISSTVKNTASHTEEASEMARHNAEVAAAGGRAMLEVVQTMEGIRGSSARIGEIISTIDAIAFQTNILALNAAVEAARAGEAGRGFAVVASEVRVLAQRSAGAAREIKTLIGGSVEQVENGTVVVRRAGSTIEEIVESSRRVNQLLCEISTSAREQSAGVGQIGQAVNELDRMTQQNAALVEQTAAASSAMKDQAVELVKEVERFRIPAETAGPAGTQAAVAVADFDFDKAIEAHRQWKVKLRKAISSQEQLDADTICRDDQCPLGKWIHGPGGSQWGGKPAFVALTQRHAEFHQAAGDAARRINARRFEDAERLIGSGSRFAQVSTEVATLLAKAKRGL